MIKKILSNNSSLTILVIGDLMLDGYIWGTVDRISPEAPVQILETISDNSTLGGAANVINNLAALGCKIMASGIIGKDENGNKILKLLKAKHVNTTGVIKDPEKPTINKIRVIASSQQILRIDRESKRPTSKHVEEKIIEFLKKHIKLVDGIICSDYEKGVLSRKVLKIIFQEAKKNSKIVIIDPKGNDYSKYKGATIITPNEKELIAATPGINPEAEHVIQLRANHLFSLLNTKAILVTRGKDGMALFEQKGMITNIPTETQEVFDVTGAGDTVISVFAMLAFSGCDLITSTKLANKAAGIVVGKVGTSVISKEELIYSYEKDNIFLKRKIVTLEELKRIVSLLKNQKKKIVFTNGCFDLLHIGHIKYLEDAKNLGDILIIGLNDDNSIRKLKGSKRPLIDQHQRANILAALNCIDYITIFSESTPENIIINLSPHVLVKGGDYSIDEVVGKSIVEAYGGNVQLIPVVKNISTSRIVKGIVKKYSVTSQ